MSSLVFSETELTRSIVKEHFFSFVKEFWHSVIPEEPIWNWHIEYLCDELQDLAERVFEGKPKKHDLIINIPPGSTKSTIVSVLFPPWTWTRMPSARHIAATHAQDLGLDLSRKSRDVIQETVIGTDESDMRPGYPLIFPEIKLREDQNTKGYYVNTRGGYRKSVTVGGVNPVGFHGHFIEVDDPIDPQKALSEVELENANDFMNRTLPSRKVDKSVTPTIVVMQRLHQNDPTGNRLENKKSGKVKHICLPADLNEGYEVKPKRLKKFYVDGLLDPNRMDRQVLKEARGQLGEYGYAGQFGQSPVPRGGGTFEVEKLKIGDPPPLHTFKRLVRFWDKAGTASDTADYTAGVLLGEIALNKQESIYWVLHAIRGQWSIIERERTILSIAELDGKKVIVGIEQEVGAAGKESAQATVRRLSGYRVRPIRPTGDKTVRAEPFAAQVGSENVYVARGEWNYDFIEELRYFPKGKNDDQVDAGSGAFNIIAKARKRIGAL